MAETLQDLDPSITEALPEGFAVAVANLSEEGQQQVVDALQDNADQGGTVDEVNPDGVLQDAQLGDDHRENVEAIKAEQAEAVEDGDLDKAHELAVNAEYEIREVEATGGESDQQIAQAEHDQAHIEDAQMHEGLSEMHAENAEYHAEMGNTDAAAGEGVNAGYEAGTAADTAHAADAGGTDASHDYSSASSTADTTSE
jgi:hypothetical protein